MSQNNGLSRREFVKTSAAAMSAAAVMTGLGTNFAHAAGSDRIKVGLIGCGGRGTGAGRDCIQSDKAVQITAMGDLFQDRLDTSRQQLSKFGEQYAVSDGTAFVGFDAYKKVIDSDVDLVLLCEPPGFRPTSFAYAIEKGKHVFAEKPIAVDAVGVRKFLEASEKAKQKNLAVVAGTVFRHHKTHIDAIQQIHDGKFGDIVGGSSYYNVGHLWHKPRQPGWTDMEWQCRNWLYFTWLSGDHIVEQNVHRIDIMNWVMKAHPLNAYGMGGREVRTDPMYGNIYDHFSVEYEYPNGVRITNQCRQIDGTDARITEYFYGTKGIVEPSKGPKLDKRVRPLPLAEGYVQEHIDLVQSIKSGKPLNEGQQVAETTLTAIMGRMSAYTGKEVSWQQAMESKLDLFPKNLDLKGAMPVPPVPMPGKDALI